MGIRYSAIESNLLIEVLNDNIKIANEITNRLSRGSNHLLEALESGKLKGAAYNEGKTLFSEIIVTSIKKIQLAVYDIQRELESYKNADGIVSKFENLDLDELKIQKEIRNRQLSEIKKQIRKNQEFITQIKVLFNLNLGDYIELSKSLSEMEYQLELDITEIEEKITKLEWFVRQVSKYFNDSLQILNLAMEGAKQLNKLFADSNGIYNLESIDMSWFEKLNAQQIITEELDKNTPVTKKEIEAKLITTDFINSYGFDSEMANILYQLQQSIIKISKKKNWSKEQMLYEFNRLVASPVYAGDSGRVTWSGLAGTLKNEDLRKVLIEEYGFSDTQVEKFIIGIDTQHKSSTNVKDYSHEAVQLSTFTGQTWGNRDLSKISGWLELSAHIISTFLNSMRVVDVDINTEKYESSFKGDIDSRRYDDTDFNSDLDAMNVYDRIVKNGNVDNVFLIQPEYNRQIFNNEVNRVNEFYKSLGEGNQENGEAVLNYLIEHDTLGGKYLKDELRWDLLWQNDTDTNRKAKDDFYEYLKRGENKNVGS